MKPPIGNLLSVQLLQRALDQSRVHNAYLFVGSQGIGKRTLARWFAEQLLSVPGKQQPFLDGHPDFYTLAPVDTETGKRGTVKIEAVQSLIRDLRQQPLRSDRSVILLDQADAMTLSAANALLKTLEEPRKAVLLLTTDRAEAVVNTIRSRCQTFYLQPLSESECRSVLAPFVREVPSELIGLAPGQPGQILQHCRLVNALEPVRAALQHGVQSPHECLALAQSLKTLLQTQQAWLLQWWQRSLFDQPHLLAPFDQAIAQLTQNVQPELVWGTLLLHLQSQGVVTLHLPAPIELHEPITVPTVAVEDSEPKATKSRQTRKSSGTTKTKGNPTITSDRTESSEPVTAPVETPVETPVKATPIKQHSLFAKSGTIGSS